MDDNPTKKFEHAIDKLCSGTEYVTNKDILRECFGPCPENQVISYSNDYKYLKKIINNHKEVFEFKNGKDARGGFHFKKEYFHYFRRRDEEKELRSKEGGLKKLFLTGGLQMLFEEKTISNPRIDFECITKLENISLVKTLYPYVGKRVISFKYNKGYKECTEVIIHPHLLKEYNSRWFLFGYIENKETKELEIGNCSLDRIVYENENSIMVHPEIGFHEAQDGFYQGYFKDIVGVTKVKEKPIQHIIIKTTNFKVHQLIKTKPIHEASQKETKEFDTEKKEGEFEITVIPNMELQTRLLSYGAGICVIGDGDFQQQIRKTIANMVRNYLW